MNQNNEKIYGVVEKPITKVVGVGTRTTEKIDKLGDSGRGCAVGVLSAWFFAKLFYPSGLPP